VIGLDLAGAAVSAGAACSSGKVKVSRVLTAAGWDESLASCAIRASFGWASAHGDGERLALLYIKAARGRRPAAKEN
jgi:cysteine desulfurase